jgi:hypothetical protein
MATRKATIKMEKMSETEILTMIAKSTDNGFPVPAKLLISASNFKTVAKMFDSGLIDMQTTAYGAMYTITTAGRTAIN